MGADNDRDENRDAVLLSIVGVERAIAIEVDELVSRIAAVVNHGVSCAPIENTASGKTACAITIAGRLYTVIAMSHAVPPGDLAVAVQAAYGWTQAGDAVRRSCAHYIVASLSAPGGHAEAVQQSADLTTITATLLDLVPATFVYWGSGDALVEPSAFRAAAEAMVMQNRPPVLNWVQFRLLPGRGAGAPGMIGMLTTGLRPFVGREIEMDPMPATPVEVARLTVRLAEHLIREGPIFADGDSVDIGGNANVLVHLVEKGRVNDGPSFQIRMPERSGI